MSSNISKNSGDWQAADDLKQERSPSALTESSTYVIDNLGKHDASLNRHDQDIDRLGKRYAELDRKLSQSEKRIGESEKSNEKLKDDINTDRFRSIEILTFFVAFFTFVSVEFQLFASMTELYQVLSLTFILFGFLTCFVLLLFQALNSQLGKASKSQHINFFIFSASCVFFGLIIFAYGDMNNTISADSVTEHVDTKYEVRDE